MYLTVLWRDYSRNYDENKKEFISMEYTWITYIILISSDLTELQTIMYELNNVGKKVKLINNAKNPKL